MAREHRARAPGRRASVVRLWTILIGTLLAAVAAVPANAAISYVQGGSAPLAITGTSVATYPGAQSAGSLNVVIVAWATGATVTGVTDSAGSTYTLAGTTVAGAGSQAVYYAKNVAAAGTNAVTVSLSYSTYISVVVLQYTGLDLTAPFDAYAGGSGTGTTASSGSATATTTNSLVLGVISVASGAITIGSGFTSRVDTSGAGNGGILTEDRFVTATGSYSASSPLQSTGTDWVAQAIIFKGTATGDTQAPTAPTNVSATAASSSQINLSWTAATDNVAVTGYRVERCAGSGCSQFLLQTTTTGVSYSDTNVLSSTSYNYRIKAIDAANNVSPSSSTATVLTPAGTALPASVSYTYDNAGRLRGAAYSDGTATSYTLDAPGNRTVAATTPPTAALQFSPATYSVSEGVGTASLTVTRGPFATPAVSVQFATSNGSALAGSDFTATSGTLSWAANDTTSRTISVPIANDAVFESDESFLVTLSNPTGPAVLGSASQATVSIVDNDAVSFSIAPATVSEATGTATITVTRSGSSSLTHSVNFATTAGTATAGTDYTDTSGTLTFLPSDVTKTFSVTINNDAVFEGNETFTATLSAPTNGATLGSSSATIALTDSTGAPSFAVSNVTVSENAGSASFTVTKTGGSALTHSVSFATSNGSAASGGDYTAASGQLTFDPGETSKVVTVTIVNDAVYETDETFNFTLSAPTNGAVIGAAAAVGTILNDDAAPSFAIAPVSVSEGAGTATVTVTKTGSTALTHAVNYSATDGSAVSGSDYTFSGGTLTFAPGDTTKTFVITILNDSVSEPGESLTASISGATNGAAIGTGSATVTIVDDDAAPTFSISGETVTEGTAGATFTVTKNGSTTQTHAVTVTTSDGTALTGTDYLYRRDTLTFGPSVTSQTFSVVLGNDTTYEGTETFTAALSDPTNGATIATGPATITILDNDPAPSFSINSPTGTEASGQLTFTVTKSGSTALSHAVNFVTADGSAQAGLDYTNSSGTLTFAPGETSKSIPITVANDTLAEGNESFYVNLSGATNGASIGSSQGVGTIVNTDRTPPDVPANVQATAPSATQVNVSWTASNDTGGSGVAYYTVNRNGSYLSTTTATSYIDTTVAANTPYTYTVSATDGAGNSSVFSSTGGAVTTPPASYTSTSTMTMGGFIFLTGFSSGNFGSMSPTTTTTGKTYFTFYDSTAGGTSVISNIAISGFTSDPGAGWLISATARSVTKTGASATYTYSGGTATWSWNTLFNFLSSGTTSCTVVHK